LTAASGCAIIRGEEDTVRGKKAKLIRKVVAAQVAKMPAEVDMPTNRRQYYQHVKKIYKGLNRITKRGIFNT
jgi:hypothetical protein